MAAAGAPEIDEDRESRQMAVYGRAAMLKMSKSRVLISGMNGIGAETAKNVILANVKEVILHDPQGTNVTPADLGSNFYLSEKHVGKHRAESCRALFQELNPSCSVSASSAPLTPEFVSAAKLDVVVMCTGSLEDAVAIDAACRSTVLEEQAQCVLTTGEKKRNGVVGLKELRWTPTTCFIYAAGNGLLGSIFCDFGPTFVVNDPTGEQTKTGIVRAVKKDDKHSVAHFVVEDEIDFDQGEYAEFTELKGLEALNSTPEDPKLVKLEDVYIGRKLCHIGDLSDIPGEYLSGGILTQRKLPKEMSFRSMAECMKDPGAMHDVDTSKWSPKAKAFDESVLAHFGQPNFNTKFGRSGLLMLLLRAIDAVGAKVAATADGPDKVVEQALKINDAADPDTKVEELEGARLDTLKRLARGAGAVLNPMAAIVGGIVGQEVVKACSFKFTPTHQWWHFDAEECLPDQLPPCAALPGGRYDDQIQVFGQDFQDVLARLRVFLVGSGALGCEFLKNFSLMGIAAGDGLVTVTDDDIIEKSNLSRQFLFRNHNVGKHKSSSAAEAACVMNPQFKVKPLQDRVAPNTEDVFDDKFWLATDIIANALDNVKARLYVDSKCVFFGKPLLESGTLGPKCNQQSVIPGFTENYGAQKDPEEKTAPMCALHNFPHNIDMCLGLGRSEFTGNFETVPTDVNDYVKLGGAKWVQDLTANGENSVTIKDKLKGDPKINCVMPGGVFDALGDRPSGFADCVRWARCKYQSYFVDRIRLLTYNFPEDEKTESGKPFWSPPKRFPHEVPFDPANASAMNFIIAASNLRARLFGMQESHRDPEYFVAMLQKVEVPEFKPFKAKLDSGEGAEGEEGAEGSEEKPRQDDEDTDKLIADAVREIDATLATPLKAPLFVNEFEKDDDSNFHIMFIQCFANLRAANYDIPPVDFLQAKLKAGRIIPAIATATAAATGFVCLEMYKLAGKRPNSAFRNMFSNLALPLLTQSDPTEATKITSGTHFDPLMHMDVDEIAIPDPQTVWTTIFVPDGKTMTPNKLKKWLDEQYGAEMGDYSMVYPDPQKPGAVKGETGCLAGCEDMTFIEVFEKKGLSTAGKQLLEIHNGSTFVLEATTKDGDDARFARLVLDLR
eukprot:TRINITY_DN2376_c0_g2_i1.p1 TRINITY_DN2376_c0_g2~~TRINITY_DN2376_c0_g2_i1.p1  ORF type:complete len:1147 (+),score=469.97 TRINITY_DN2376_c0_g2_i1:78-3443(+)